jgi:hypothetical protein
MCYVCRIILRLSCYVHVLIVYNVGFDVLTAASVLMVAFQVKAPCSQEEIDQRLRVLFAYFVHSCHLVARS